MLDMTDWKTFQVLLDAVEAIPHDRLRQLPVTFISARQNLLVALLQCSISLRQDEIAKRESATKPFENLTLEDC